MIFIDSLVYLVNKYFFFCFNKNKHACSWRKHPFPRGNITEKLFCFVGFIRKWSKVEFIFLYTHTLMCTFTQASFLEPSAVTGWPCSISSGLSMVNGAELLVAFKFAHRRWCWNYGDRFQGAGDRKREVVTVRSSLSCCSLAQRLRWIEKLLKWCKRPSCFLRGCFNDSDTFYLFFLL